MMTSTPGRRPTWRFTNLSIRQKFLFPMVVALAIMLTSVCFYFPNKQKKAVLQAYQLSASRTAELLAVAAGHALAQHSFALVQKILRDARIDSNISFVILFDQEGEQFAAFNPKNVTLPRMISNDDATLATFEKNGIVVEQTILGSDGGAPLARLVLGYSLQNLRHEITNFYLTTAIFTLISFFLGFLFIEQVADRITKSIFHLQSQMRRIIKNGSYDGKVVVKTRDEVGLLAIAFNKMMRELHERHRRLETSEAKLRKANKRLQEINNLKTIFVSDASHHLRTPLTIINGEVEIALQHDRDTAEYRETLQIIGEETGRLSKIVENLLTLAKAEAGNLVVLQRNTDFSAICDRQALRFRALAEARRIVFHQDIQPDCVVNGDPQRLAELVANLVDNAVKYTPEGGEVSIRLAHEESQYCVLNISDNGYGIPEEEQHKIFSRFYRGRNPANTASGTGLGLAICDSIVKAHGGQIHVQSSVGAGSVFEVRLRRQ